MQFFTHYFLHFGFPLFVALLFFNKDWKKTYLILLATMLVDLDHLLADPIFQEDRCSIAFHYLHSYYAIMFYIVLLFFKGPIRIVGIGLLLHMCTDLIDCMFMFAKCELCMTNAPAIELLKMIKSLKELVL